MVINNEEKTEQQQHYFQSISSFKDDIKKSKNTFGERGWDTSLPVTDSILSFKKGYTTNVYSYAHSGKTQWVIENSVFLAKKYGVKTAFHLTEAGSKAEAVLDIVQTVLGKQAPEITDEELLGVFPWIEEHFYFSDIDSRLATVNDILNGVYLLQKSGINIENVVIDHYHMLEKNEKQSYMDRADMTKDVLKMLTRGAKKCNVHIFILFHVRDTNPVQCKESKIWYLPLPEPSSLSGGQQAHYLSQNMVAIYRPITREDQQGVVNPITGIPYDLNETVVVATKIKPKGAGKLGARSIYFDVQAQRYYCKDGFRKVYMNNILDSSTSDSITNKREDLKNYGGKKENESNLSTQGDIF